MTVLDQHHLDIYLQHAHRNSACRAALHFLAVLENDKTFPRRRLFSCVLVTSEYTEKHEKDALASGAR